MVLRLVDSPISHRDIAEKIVGLGVRTVDRRNGCECRLSGGVLTSRELELAKKYRPHGILRVRFENCIDFGTGAVRLVLHKAHSDLGGNVNILWEFLF